LKYSARYITLPGVNVTRVEESYLRTTWYEKVIPLFRVPHRKGNEKFSHLLNTIKQNTSLN